MNEELNKKLSSKYELYIDLKIKVSKLLELIERNTTNLWADNIEYTLECVLLEDVNSDHMRCPENEPDPWTGEGETKCQENYQFNGHEIVELIDEIKQELEL